MDLIQNACTQMVEDGTWGWEAGVCSARGRVTLGEKNGTFSLILCVSYCCCCVQSETEWQHFLCQCLEVVAKVAELTTAETFQAIVSSW